MVAFLYDVIIVSILLLVNGIYQIAVGTPRKKALDEHHKLSWKLTNAGSETENLKRAKECYFQLLTSYKGVKGFANANERYCYEDDIDLIRDNAEMLAERRWASKADEYLLKMEEAHSLIVQHNFNNIEKAYSSKATFLKAYDAYFDWTRKCHDDNYGIWKSVKLWDEAKKCVTELLGETGEYVFWDSTFPSSYSVRQQIDANLTKHIESMRPEYLRKIKLNSLILNKIASCGSIKRSVLLKSSFDGFTAPEVQACYHGLVKAHDVIEVKQGSLYFVSLSDAVATRHCQQQEKAVPQILPVTESKEETMIAPMTKVLCRELIRHFDEEGIEYVNKTTSGGELYFFSEAEAGSLKEKGYPVGYAKNGTKGTGHRPAWYIKFVK